MLGYFWSLARPFLLFGVIYLVFSEFAKLGDEVKHYPVYILFALVLFQFFAETTSNGLTSLVDREHLLRKVRFPRLVIPLAVALTSLFNLLMTLLAVMVFAIANGVYPMWSWLQLPLLVGILAVLSLGIGDAAVGAVRPLPGRRADLGGLLPGAVLRVTDPVRHDDGARELPARLRRRPLAALFAQMRHAMIDPSAPTAWEAIGGAERLLIPGGIVVGAFALGWWVFHREAPRIAENL